MRVWVHFAGSCPFDRSRPRDVPSFCKQAGYPQSPGSWEEGASYNSRFAMRTTVVSNCLPQLHLHSLFQPVHDGREPALFRAAFVGWETKQAFVDPYQKVKRMDVTCNFVGTLKVFLLPIPQTLDRLDRLGVMGMVLPDDLAERYVARHI